MDRIGSVVACVATSLSLAIGSAACQQPAPATTPDKPVYPVPDVAPEGPVIAKVGTVAFTTKELEKRINKQSPFMRQRFSDVGKREQFLKNEIRFELLAQEAWRRGLYEDPRIIASLKKSMVQRLIRDEHERLTESIKLTEAELRAGYTSRKAEFVKPERVRVAQIVRYVKTPAERKAAKKLLSGLQSKLTRLEKKNVSGGFAKITEENSQDEGTRRSGGNLPFMSEAELTEKYGEAVAKAAFSMEIGDKAIAEAPNAVLLIKKTGRRRAVNRTLETVKTQLRAKLLQTKRNQAFDEFVAQLETKAGVKIDQTALKAAVPDLEKSSFAPKGK